jgi:hypothetical protein
VLLAERLNHAAGLFNLLAEVWFLEIPAFERAQYLGLQHSPKVVSDQFILERRELFEQGIVLEVPPLNQSPLLGGHKPKEILQQLVFLFAA